MVFRPVVAHKHQHPRAPSTDRPAGCDLLGLLRDGLMDQCSSARHRISAWHAQTNQPGHGLPPEIAMPQVAQCFPAGGPDRVSQNGALGDRYDPMRNAGYRSRHPPHRFVRARFRGRRLARRPPHRSVPRAYGSSHELWRTPRARIRSDPGDTEEPDSEVGPCRIRPVSPRARSLAPGTPQGLAPIVRPLQRYYDRVRLLCTVHLRLRPSGPAARQAVDGAVQSPPSSPDLYVPGLSPNPPKKSARAAAVECSAVAGTMVFHRITSQPQGAPIRC